jgi:hypothetical protein
VALARAAGPLPVASRWAALVPGAVTPGPPLSGPAAGRWRPAPGARPTDSDSEGAFHDHFF